MFYHIHCKTRLSLGVADISFDAAEPVPDFFPRVKIPNCRSCREFFFSNLFNVFKFLFDQICFRCLFVGGHFLYFKEYNCCAQRINNQKTNC